MTLQQLRYVIAVADHGSMNEAAKALFISQPSLSGAVKELEKELGFELFLRTSRGIVVTPDGEEFLGYARQVTEQYRLLRNRYIEKESREKFSVSMQHYSFAVKAFVETVKRAGMENYEFAVYETRTYEIIENVRNFKSELGILYLDDENKNVITRALREKELVFTPLFEAKPHVFISSVHPLATKKTVDWDDLAPYPYLSFEQGEHNSLYFSEEIFSSTERKKNIRVRDRATLFNLLIGLNGYTVCSGVIDKKLNGKDIIAAPLADESDMRIGYITHKKGRISRLGTTYLEALNKYFN